MSANTAEKKARLLDLMTGILEMTRDGNRDPQEVSDVLQVIKEEPRFAEKLRILFEDFIGVVIIPTTAEKFVARDKFVFDIGQQAPVKISTLGSFFSQWFLDKIEEPSGGERTLRFQKLLKSSLDYQIIARLGGEAKSETTLMEMFALIARQKNGGDGALLTRDRANVFYIRDISGQLRAVILSYYEDGHRWVVYAQAIESFRNQSGGARVFSRN